MRLFPTITPSKFSVFVATVSLTLVGLSPNLAMAETSGTLRFSELEFNAPSDPLLWSSTPNRAEQHTPASDIQYAVNQLNAAIPVGLSASEAHARLQAAGARCDMTDPSAIDCHYNDVQTPDSEYVDSVVWKITVPLVDGRVADLKVARDWYRR